MTLFRGFYGLLKDDEGVIEIDSSPLTSDLVFPLYPIPEYQTEYHNIKIRGDFLGSLTVIGSIFRVVVYGRRTHKYRMTNSGEFERIRI
jgi:hypothetical protein